MPDSMFGRPSQHLLPSHPPPSAGDSSVVSDSHNPPPVLPVPVPFKDFRFNSIGKQPELLSRISLPRLDHTDYHSSTPSPTSPPPIFINHDVPQSKLSSRPTLFQQLAGSSSMNENSGWNASTNQTSRSLASRIQMNNGPSSDVVNTTPSMAPRSPSPVSRISCIRGAADLIPPVEVLPQSHESLPATPASLAPTLELLDTHSPASSTPLVDTIAINSSWIPTPPPVSVKVPSREPPESFPPATNATTQDLQSFPPAVSAIDSLLARQERLQTISTNLAKLAFSLPSSLSHSPSPIPSSATRMNDNANSHQPSQSQHINKSNPANDSAGRVGLGISDTPMNTDESSLVPVHPPTTVTQEHLTQRKAVIEAVENLNSALIAVHRAQIDSENALALQIRTFEEQRTVFEQTKRTKEATFQKKLQELQQKREELDAKEALVISLEKESKAREVARNAMLEKRLAQDEEKRAIELKRVQEVQERIAAAMTELREIDALKANSQLGQLSSQTVPDDLPTEPQEGMDEEEKAIVKSRNDLLLAIKHLRRMHSDKLQKLEESNRTLRRLEEGRKQKGAEEAERRRIVEEKRSRAHVEAEQTHQLLDEKQRRFEAERKRRVVEYDREQARSLSEQQAYGEAQAHSSRGTEATSGQTFKHRGHPEEVDMSQPLGNMTGTHVAPEATSLSTAALNVVVEDEKTPVLLRTDGEGSQSTTSQSNQKKDKPVLRGTLPTSSPKDGMGHLPLAKPAPFSTSGHATESSLNPPRTSSNVIVPVEGGHRSTFPAQLASEFNRVTNTDIRPTPDYKPAFPRTPKSQTLLDATIGGSQEFNIGPVPGVSPAQRTLNLRHLKRSHSRIEENESGDRSARVNTKVKSEESTVSLKREQDDQPRDRVQTPLLSNPPTSLPPRPTVIPPPRPRKRHAAPAPLTDSSSPYPSESNKLSSKTGAEVIIAEQPRETLSRGNPSSQVMNTSVQLPTPTETTNSLLLGPAHTEPQPPEDRVIASDRPTENRTENEKCNATSSEPASATLSHALDGEDPFRNNKRFVDEPRTARNGNNSRRLSDHYTPSFVTPQPYRLTDSRRVQFNVLRAEAMRAISPTAGRKRSLEFDDDDHGYRARRQRDDVWIAQDHDSDRVDSYRPPWDRRVDSDPDERRAVHRGAPFLPDRIWSYPSDLSKPTDDNRPYILPFSEEPTAVYEEAQGMTDIQPDPPLLARMTHTQRFLPSTNLRGRGRGEPNRGSRGDFGRGRGRGLSRNGPALIERLTSGPSLGDRLS